jgi:hypothetical protein
VAQNSFVMTEEEKYFFDLRGYLVVQNAMSQELIDACNAAIDHFHDRVTILEKGSQTRGSAALSADEGRGEIWGLLGWPAPYRDPFRKLLIHPVVVSRLNELCGKRFRLDHGPWLITGRKGSDGHRLHGGGEPFSPSNWYHQQNGRIYCRAVTVSWQLADVPAGAGGFCCIPGSHKSCEPTPQDVVNVDDDMGLVLQPEMKAGDVVFFAEATTHGTLPWRADHERRSILYKYTERANARDVGPYFTPQERLGEWTNELAPEQQALLYGPGQHTGGKPLPYIDSDGENVWISETRVGADVRKGLR